MNSSSLIAVYDFARKTSCGFCREHTPLEVDQQLHNQVTRVSPLRDSDQSPMCWVAAAWMAGWEQGLLEGSYAKLKKLSVIPEWFIRLHDENTDFVNQ